MSSGGRRKPSRAAPTLLPTQALVLKEFQGMLSEVFNNREIKSTLKSLLHRLSKGTLGSSRVAQLRRIWHCHCYDTGLTPRRGTSTCHRHGQKKRNSRVMGPGLPSASPSKLPYLPLTSPSIMIYLQGREIDKESQFFFFFCCFFLQPHLRHMEVPRLGIELELQLQLQAAVPQPPQNQIRATPNEARGQTCILTETIWGP